MKQLLTEQKVLRCLDKRIGRTAWEIVVLYNRTWPPMRYQGEIGPRTEWDEIEIVLEVLIKKAEVESYVDTRMGESVSSTVRVYKIR